MANSSDLSQRKKQFQAAVKGRFMSAIFSVAKGPNEAVTYKREAKHIVSMAKGDTTFIYLDLNIDNCEGG